MLEKLNIQYFEWRKEHYTHFEAKVILCHPQTATDLINEHNESMNSMAYVSTVAKEIRFRGIKIYRSFDVEEGIFIIA